MAGLPKLLKSMLQRSEVNDEVLDLLLVHLEFWHGAVTCPDSLSQGFLQTFDRVTPVQSSKRRGVGQRAITPGSRRMTSSAIYLYKGFAALNQALVGLRRLRHKESTYNNRQAGLFHSEPTIGI